LEDSLNDFGKCALLSKHKDHHKLHSCDYYFIYLAVIVKYEVWFFSTLKCAK